MDPIQPNIPTPVVPPAPVPTPAPTPTPASAPVPAPTPVPTSAPAQPAINSGVSRRIPKILVAVVATVVFAGAAYVFGYDRTVLLSTKSLLARTLVEAPERIAGDLDVTATIVMPTQAPSTECDSIECIRELQSIEATIETAAELEIVAVPREGAAHDMAVAVRSARISVLPASAIESYGLPSTIEIAGEIRTVGEQGYFKIDRVSPELEEILAMITVEAPLGQWYVNALESTDDIESDAPEENKKFFERAFEAVTVVSDERGFGTRVVQLSVDPIILARIAIEEGFVEADDAEAALNDIEDMDMTIEARIEFDRHARVQRATVNATSLLEEIDEGDVRVEYDISFVRTEGYVEDVVAPENARQISVPMGESSVPGAQFSPADQFSLLLPAFEESSYIYLMEAGTYEGYCALAAGEIDLAMRGLGAVSENLAAPSTTQTVYRFNCYDDVHAFAASGWVQERGQPRVFGCVDSELGATFEFQPIADPITRTCNASIR